MEQTKLYKEDWIGLRELNESGRLIRKHINNKHCEYNKFHVRAMFVPFLKKK